MKISQKKFSESIIKKAVVGVLGLLSMLSLPVYADDFVNHYGTYKINHNEGTGVAFIYPTYEFQKDKDKSHIIIRKSPSSYASGHIEKITNDILFIKYKKLEVTPFSRANWDMLSSCLDVDLESGNTNFNCSGLLFSAAEDINFTLERISGREEVNLLSSWFDAIPADDYVGVYTIPADSHDKGETDSKVTFRKSMTNFLDVNIENDLFSFKGVAKPIGHKSLLISYRDELDELHAIECLVSMNNSKYDSLMYCEGTLQGVKLKSKYGNTFLLKR